MDESKLIEKAKANWMCHAGVRATDPELAAWMEGHGKDVLYLSACGKWYTRGYRNRFAEHDVYRLRPDYEPLKWWFHPRDLSMMRGVEIAHGPERPDHSPGWLEVTAGYAAYLRDKPEGEWELRMAKSGDTCWNADGENVAFVAGTNYKDAGANDRGYRWCKPRVDVEALRKAFEDADQRYRDALEVSWQAFCVKMDAQKRLEDAMKGGAE